MSAITHKTWDSNFFGFKTGDLDFSGDAETLSQLLAEASADGYQLLYWKIPPSDFRSQEAAQQLNFFKGDTKVIYSLPLDLEVHTPGELQIKNWNETPNNELIQLGISSGQYSRFKSDEKFPQGTYEKMYAEWVLQSVNGHMGDELFYIASDNQIIGLITLKYDNQIAEIGLVAVDEHHQQKGIGKQLVQFAIGQSQNKEMAALLVATQLENLAANKLYAACGGEIILIEHIYHIWLI